jgi:hypothetical protein
MVITQLLVSCDGVGEENKIYNNGGTTKQTKIGGILTILLILGILFTTWTLGKDIIYKKKPNILIQNLLSTNRPHINLTSETFPISICLQGAANEVYFDADYVQYEAVKIEVNNQNGVVNNTYYDIVKCEKRHFPNFSEEKIKSIGLTNYYCIDNQNINIYGFWNEESLSTLRIQLKKCKSRTTCKSEEEINKWLDKPLWFNLYVQNSLIDLTDSKNPIKYFVQNIYKAVKKELYKYLEIYIKQSEIKSDFGIIFEDYSTVKANSVGETQLDFSNIDEEGILFSFHIYPSSDTTIYERNYVKCQNIAANMGGIIKFLFLACFAINYYFSHTLRNVEILNIIISKSNNSQLNKILSHQVPQEDKLTNNTNKKNEVMIKNNFVNCNHNISRSIILKNESFSNKEVSNLNNNKSESKNMKKDNNNLNIMDTSKDRVEINKFHFTYYEIFIMLLSKIFCGIYWTKSKEFRQRIESYKKNYSIIINSLDIKNMIKSGSVLEVLDDLIEKNTNTNICSDNQYFENKTKIIKNE